MVKFATDMSEFRFKQFSVSHDRSSMKVGVDGVLIGCWCHLDREEIILDLGTGCGLIALICAQRSVASTIRAIDIDVPSVEEASANFQKSPWSDRLSAECLDFTEMPADEKFTVIVSNPPFFNAGVINDHKARTLARHQIGMTLEDIVVMSKSHLVEGGRLDMILPVGELDSVRKAVEASGCSLTRITYVRGHEKAPLKRVMTEIVNRENAIRIEESVLTLSLSDGSPTDEHRALCGEFYLHF